MRHLRRLSAALLLPLTACGVSANGPTEAGPPAVARPADSIQFVRLFFVGPHGIALSTRPISTPPGPQQALDLLAKGPVELERARGLTTVLTKMSGRLTAKATKNAVDVYLPPSAAEEDMGPTGISQIACTAAHADIPGKRPPPHIDVRIHEEGDPSEKGRNLRCDSSGSVSPHPG